MTQQHDAPESGAAHPVAWRGRDRDGCPWNVYRNEADVRRDGWRFIEPLYASSAAPTPPAPSGLVDAVRAYLAAVDAYTAWSTDPDQGGCSADHYNAEWDRLAAAVVIARLTLDATLSGQQGGPSHDRAMAEGGWQELGDWRPKPWVRIDLWIQCYDLADRDSDRLVPTVGKRVPGAVWFDGQWCNGDGNPHEDFEGFEDAKVTHWRPEPAPPEFSVSPEETAR